MSDLSARTVKKVLLLTATREPFVLFFCQLTVASKHVKQAGKQDSISFTLIFRKAEILYDIYILYFIFYKLLETATEGHKTKNMHFGKIEQHK